MITPTNPIDQNSIITSLMGTAIGVDGEIVSTHEHTIRSHALDYRGTHGILMSAPGISPSTPIAVPVP